VLPQPCWTGEARPPRFGREAISFAIGVAPSGRARPANGETGYHANVAGAPANRRRSVSAQRSRELIEFSTAFGNRPSAARETALVMVYRRHRIHAWTDHSVNHVEAALDAEGIEGHIPQPPAICFVDLTGYTRLTEERGDRFAADAPAQLASLVKHISRRRAEARSGGWATEGCSTSGTRPAAWTPAWIWSSRPRR